MTAPLESIVHLDSKLAEKPIELPLHPYLAAIKDFGSDELLAAVVDPVSTTILASVIPPHLKGAILPFVGPVTEKIAFFPRHLLQARQIYRTMPVERRKPFKHYFKEGVKHGSTNLLEDVMWHDPLYMGMMAAGLQYTDIHPGVLSAASYVIAVFAASGIIVAKAEARHHRTRKKLEKMGFVREEYYESRFHISTERPPDDIIEAMYRRFGLSMVSTVKYDDVYLQTSLAGESGRRVKMRLRTRDRRPHEKDDTQYGRDPSRVSTMQVIYTRAREQKVRNDQCNYFPVHKEKHYRVMDAPIRTLDEIRDLEFAKQTKQWVDGNVRDGIRFERTNAHNEQLAVCTDRVDAKRPFYVLELKVYDDTTLLKEAMRYVMVDCPIVAHQTTWGKHDLIVGA
ncbi:MAG: hypothetical protein ABIH41_04575 [Nanoarchaeota archaeon]